MRRLLRILLNAVWRAELAHASGYRPTVWSDAAGRPLSDPGTDVRNYAVVHRTVRTGVNVAHACLADATSLLPLARLVRRARRQRLESRSNSGFGPACGYDVRATPERCQECGLVPAGPWTGRIG